MHSHVHSLTQLYTNSTIFISDYEFNTLPQDEVYIFNTPILKRIVENEVKPRDLARIPANWCPIGTCNVLIDLANNFSLTIWQSMLICLVRLWNTGLAIIWSVAWLSQKRATGLELWIAKSFNRCYNYVISQVAIAIAWYSASRVDLDIVFYFFDF